MIGIALPCLVDNGRLRLLLCVATFKIIILFRYVTLFGHCLYVPSLLPNSRGLVGPGVIVHTLIDSVNGVFLGLAFIVKVHRVSYILLIFQDARLWPVVDHEILMHHVWILVDNAVL